MKRKLILLGPAHPLRGGIAAFNHQLGRAFQDQDWEVQFISYSYQYPSILFPGKNQYTESPKPTDLNIESKMHSINIFSWNKLAKEIADLNPELVIAQYWMPFIGIALSSILKRIKKHNVKIHTSVLVHNLIPHEKKPGDQYFTKKILQSADSYISISNAVGDDILNVNNAVDLKRMFFPILDQYGPIVDKGLALKKLDLDPDFQYILFFGLVRKYKGLDLLIKAMTKVWNVNIKLLVVGEFYEDFLEYEKMVRQFSLQDHVIFYNKYIPDEEVKYYFSVSELLVLPYKTATQSGVTQMGLHFEKPIISTNVGGLHEVVHDGINGYLVEPEANQIAEAINTFFKNDLNIAFSNASKELKEKLSWKSFYNGLLTQIEIES